MLCLSVEEIMKENNIKCLRQNDSFKTAVEYFLQFSHVNLHLAAYGDTNSDENGVPTTSDCYTMGIRRRQTTKHGEASSRLLIFDPKPYINQCKDCLSSTNKWFFETVR